MVLNRFAPLMMNEWNRLQNEMNRVFEGITDAGRTALALSYPAVNLWEDKDNLYAEAELPGLTHDDIEVYVQGDQLTIRGERKALGDKGRWHRQERGYGKFQRVLALPVAVDADKIEAKLDQGVLFLTLPKSPEARARKIQVKAE